MAIQMSTTLRNDRGNTIETTIGTAPKLLLYTGAAPANCAASDPAGLVATITLPSDWLTAASAGVKSLNGTWAGTASGTGTVASYRIKDSGLTACHLQGTCTLTAGGGDMTLDNTNVVTGQAISVATYVLTEGGA